MNPGIFQLSAGEYHADKSCPEPSLSAGLANDLDKRSPLHAWTNSRRLNPAYVEAESATFDLGSACHAMLLEGGAGVMFLEFDDWRTKDSKAARDAAREAGRMPILAKHEPKLRAILAKARDAIGANAFLRAAFEDGKNEQSILWTQGPTWCRARPDVLGNSRKLIMDYKSTQGSAEPDSWIRNHLIPEGHDIRAIHYLQGNKATGGAEDAQYLFLVQETDAPFACSVIGLAPSLMELAARKWVRALKLWRACLASGQWPGYGSTIAWAEAPAYAMTGADERDNREGFAYDPARLWEGIR